MWRLMVVLGVLSGCRFDVDGPEWAPGFLGGEPDAAAVPDPVADAAPPPVDAQVGEPEMIAVPDSLFVRGCSYDDTVRCREDEFPQRVLHISAFEIDRHEVTRGDFKSCVDAGDCTEATCDSEDEQAEQPAPQGDLPVVCVTWFQARDYCDWRGKRLPTEAEWEKAARGGSGAFYPWGDQPEPSCVLANFDECGELLHEVGRHPAGRSTYGIDDLAGNAFEWVQDWYAPSYYAAAPDDDPQGPEGGLERVARGGSFAFGRSYLRASGRSRNAPEDSFSDLGFRCAR